MDGVDVRYHYDTPVTELPQGDNTVATAQNVKGTLAWVEDLSGEEHTSYDARGRVESVVKRIPDPEHLSRFTNHLSLVSYKTGFAYDSLRGPAVGLGSDLDIQQLTWRPDYGEGW